MISDQTAFPCSPLGTIGIHEDFTSVFASTLIESLMLQGAIRVIVGQNTIKQIAAIMTNASAPFRLDLAVLVVFFERAYFATRCFRLDVSFIAPKPGLVELIVQAREILGGENVNDAVRRLTYGGITQRSVRRSICPELARRAGF